MTTIAFVFIFLLGTIIGSFLNVVIFRFNTGKTIVNGHSICMSCSRNLRWYELIPVLSFLIQKGKCRRCATRISHQYPLVEVITGLVFALIAFHFSPIFSISIPLYVLFVSLFAFIFSILIVITVYVFIAVSFFSIFLNYTGFGPLFVNPSFWSLIAGPLFSLPFGVIWILSRGKWMGLGDAKLIMGVGWMLGPLSALCALTLSFWVGSVVSLAIMAFSKHKMNMKTEIPFAPFLIFGLLVTFLFSLDVYSLSSLFHF